MKTYAISEAVAITGLPESTLRYYERIGLIEHIGRNASSKHRAYTQDDLDRIIIIACLSATGMSISDMREYIANRISGSNRSREQIELLTQHKRQLDEEVQALVLRSRYVQSKISYWEAVERDNESEIKACSAATLLIADQLHLPRTSKNRTSID